MPKWGRQAYKLNSLLKAEGLHRCEWQAVTDQIKDWDDLSVESTAVKQEGNMLHGALREDQ